MQVVNIINFIPKNLKFVNNSNLYFKYYQDYFSNKEYCLLSLLSNLRFLYKTI